MNGSSNKSVLTILLVLFAALAVVVALFLSTAEGELRTDKRSFSELGGNFTLSSKKGNVSLSDFNGKVVVMYFGFLSCPEVCPNSMTVVSTALNRLAEQDQVQVQGLLVSVDPSRDTFDKLEQYTAFYHPRLLGLTGSKDDIDRVTRQYGAYYDFTEIESAGGDYGVEHSSRYYVIDQNGKLVAAMRHSTTPNELKAQIRELLKQG